MRVVKYVNMGEEGFIPDAVTSLGVKPLLEPCKSHALNPRYGESLMISLSLFRVPWTRKLSAKPFRVQREGAPLASGANYRARRGETESLLQHASAYVQ
jgi:hypothetical protein